MFSSTVQIVLYNVPVSILLCGLVGTESRPASHAYHTPSHRGEMCVSKRLGSFQSPPEFHYPVDVEWNLNLSETEFEINEVPMVSGRRANGGEQPALQLSRRVYHSRCVCGSTPNLSQWRKNRWQWGLSRTHQAPFHTTHQYLESANSTGHFLRV
ncbi:hypothetical protein ARMGADRAFT_307671 [Armillaria gallica]|uniref:Uncharacterized protein n=1 Tax=Armillaria gallica TaxID=47427 RepID=A0A2H3D8T0_ARMGA|nr:hypothetical protein ARMGADRAFT_307671 [Armillaria gallica]